MRTQQSPDGSAGLHQRGCTIVVVMTSSISSQSASQSVSDGVGRSRAACVPTSGLETAGVPALTPTLRHICRFMGSLKPFYVTPLHCLYSRGMLIANSSGPCSLGRHVQLWQTQQLLNLCVSLSTNVRRSSNANKLLSSDLHLCDLQPTKQA